MQQIWTRNMLQVLLRNNETKYSLQHDICSLEQYFLPLHERPEEERVEDVLLLSPDNTILVFLTEEEASMYRSRYKKSEEDVNFVLTADNAQLREMVQHLFKNGQIEKIRFYGTVPVFLEYTAEEVLKEWEQETATDRMTEQRPEETETAIAAAMESMPESKVEEERVKETLPEEPSCVQDMVKQPQQTEEEKRKEVTDSIRKALETREPNARRQLDKGNRYEDIHTLVETLYQRCGIEPAELDRILELNEGYTRTFCNSTQDINPSEEVIRKYLRYFDLEEFVYLYKKNSRDLAARMKTIEGLDEYTLKKAGNAIEPFRLEKIQQGSDESAAFVYRFTLKSKYRTVQLLLSNPLNFVEGRSYQIEGLEPHPDAQKAREAERHELDEAKLAEAAADCEQQLKKEQTQKKAGKEQDEEEGRSYEEKRKDAVIAYLKRGNSGGFKAAEAKYKVMENDTDILDEFYKYIQKIEFTPLELHGYTAKKMIKKLHMHPYEAYTTMVSLRHDPQKTKQRLIYRERDPQYQKKTTEEQQKGTKQT